MEGYIYIIKCTFIICFAGFYAFDNSSLVDSSSHGRNGIQKNFPSQLPFTYVDIPEESGSCGKAIQFLDNHQIVSIDAFKNYNFNSNFSISFWLKHNTTQSYMLLTNGPYDSFSIRVDADTNRLKANVLTGAFESNWIMDAITAKVEITKNKWHHFLFAFDGERMSLNMRNSDSHDSNVRGNIGNMYVSQSAVTFGGYFDGENPFSPFKGYLDEVIFFDLALSRPDADRIFNEQQDCYK